LILGEGQFGVVYKGLIKKDDKPEEVAVKTTKNVEDKEAQRQQLKSLLSELKLLVYIGQHPHVIRLAGAYTRQLKTGIAYVMLELCTNGCLLRLLQRSQHFTTCKEKCADKTLITNSMQFKWSCEIAKGMNYLASKKVKNKNKNSYKIWKGNDDLKQKYTIRR